MSTDAVLLMAYGSPDRLDHLEVLYDIDIEAQIASPLVERPSHPSGHPGGHPGGHPTAVGAVRPEGYVYGRAPMLVYWETTLSCGLACRHCRATAMPDRDPAELSTQEGLALLDRVTGFGRPYPHVVFTGGDPLRRPDLETLVAAATERGIGASHAPAVTPDMTLERLAALKTAGIQTMSLSIDGSDAARHDGFRVILGSSALLAIALDKPERDEFVARINAADVVGVAARTLVEAGIVLSARLGEDASEVFAELVAASDAVVIEFGAAHWQEAVSAWWRFGKSRHPASLNVRDCLACATARLAGEPLLTKGDDFPGTDIQLRRASPARQACQPDLAPRRRGHDRATPDGTRPHLSQAADGCYRPLLIPRRTGRRGLPSGSRDQDRGRHPGVIHADVRIRTLRLEAAFPTTNSTPASIHSQAPP